MICTIIECVWDFLIAKIILSVTSRQTYRHTHTQKTLLLHVVLIINIKDKKKHLKMDEESGRESKSKINK